MNFTLTSLAETSETIYLMKLEDEKNRKNKESSSQQSLLFDIICPKMFRLSYNIYGNRLVTQSVNSSPKHY
ncbi:hypothetical protein CLU79DRAFT_728870 [Phycomyces nitens]|nr:hypothetical protein CLU79DRAFT_728870 [Phycomyces nitens]